MSDAVSVAIIAAVGSFVLAIINAVIAWMQRKQQKKSGIDVRLDTIEAKQDKLTEKVDKLTVHNDLQYLSLLRLTTMDSDMPMSERLIAGKEYISRGGNGDVKAFYEQLEHSINH